MNLVEVWQRLEEDTRIAEVSGRVQRRIGPTGRRNFFLGLEMPSRNRMLILRVSASSAEGQPDVPASRGLMVRMAPRNAESQETEVELVLTDSEHTGHIRYVDSLDLVDRRRNSPRTRNDRH